MKRRMRTQLRNKSVGTHFQIWQDVFHTAQQEIPKLGGSIWQELLETLCNHYQYDKCYRIETQLSINLNTTNIDLWMISVHERGHFLPGLSRQFGNDFICEPRRIGKSQRSYILELTQTTYLNKADTPCLSSGDYRPIRITQCIQDYIMRKHHNRKTIALSLTIEINSFYTQVKLFQGTSTKFYKYG